MLVIFIISPIQDIIPQRSKARVIFLVYTLIGLEVHKPLGTRLQPSRTRKLTSLPSISFSLSFLCCFVLPRCSTAIYDYCFSSSISDQSGFFGLRFSADLFISFAGFLLQSNYHCPELSIHLSLSKSRRKEETEEERKSAARFRSAVSLWMKNPSFEKSSSGKAFCAGGDSVCYLKLNGVYL